MDPDAAHHIAFESRSATLPPITDEELDFLLSDSYPEESDLSITDEELMQLLKEPNKKTSSLHDETDETDKDDELVSEIVESANDLSINDDEEQRREEETTTEELKPSNTTELTIEVQPLPLSYREMVKLALLKTRQHVIAKKTQSIKLQIVEIYQPSVSGTQASQPLLSNSMEQPVEVKLEDASGHAPPLKKKRKEEKIQDAPHELVSEKEVEKSDVSAPKHKTTHTTTPSDHQTQSLDNSEVVALRTMLVAEHQTIDRLQKQLISLTKHCIIFIHTDKAAKSHVYKLPKCYIIQPFENMTILQHLVLVALGKTEMKTKLDSFYAGPLTPRTLNTVFQKDPMVCVACIVNHPALHLKKGATIPDIDLDDLTPNKVCVGLQIVDTTYARMFKMPISNIDLDLTRDTPHDLFNVVNRHTETLSAPITVGEIRYVFMIAEN